MSHERAPSAASRQSRLKATRTTSYNASRISQPCAVGLIFLESCASQNKPSASIQHTLHRSMVAADPRRPQIPPPPPVRASAASSMRAPSCKPCRAWCASVHRVDIEQRPPRGPYSPQPRRRRSTRSKTPPLAQAPCARREESHHPKPPYCFLAKDDPGHCPASGQHPRAPRHPIHQ